MTRHDDDDLLLGEWACLGILYRQPAHGFAVAARLSPDADVGRIWSLSRALTYRSLDQLHRRNLITPVVEEPGVAGGTRTILAPTRNGRLRFRRWLRTPVEHLRDLRSELLLKIVLADENTIDISHTLIAQRDRVESFLQLLEGGDDDVVVVWRRESALMALRFLDHMNSQERRRQ